MTSFTIIIAHGEDYPDEPLDACIKSINATLNNSVYDYEIKVATEGDRCEARNKEALESTKDVLVFFDDGVYVHHYCIDELLRPFIEHENVGVVGGPNVTPPWATDEEKIVGRLWANPLVTGRSSSRYRPKGVLRDTDEAELQLCNCAILREAFVKVGGFPPIYPNEENILYNRISAIGYRLMYNPMAIVYHDRTTLYMPYFKKMFWYGTGRGYMIRGGHGALKMIYRPSGDLVKFFLGWIIGTLAYLSGVIKGFFTYRGKGDE